MSHTHTLTHTQTHKWTQTYIDMYIYKHTKIIIKIITCRFQTILPHTHMQKNSQDWHLHTQRKK